MSSTVNLPAARDITWALNTSNAGKVADFRRLMDGHGLRLGAVTRRDLPEIDAGPREVVVHKASQFADDFVLVDDGSLAVDGHDIGVNVRWRVGHLASLAGKKAVMRVLLAFRMGPQICLCDGEVAGDIVAPRGTAPPELPILPYFQPRGRTTTLAQQRGDDVNPRALAIARLARMQLCAVVAPITEWAGGWQGEAG